MQRCQTRKRLTLRVECSGGSVRYYELSDALLLHPDSRRPLGHASTLRGFKMVQRRGRAGVVVVPIRVGRELPGAEGFVILTVTEEALARLVHDTRGARSHST